MSLMTPVPCPHQLLIDSLVVSGPDMRTPQDTDTVVRLPGGGALLMSARDVDGNSIHSSRYHWRPFSQAEVHVQVSLPDIDLAWENGTAVMVCQHGRPDVAQGLIIATDAWMSGDAQARLTLLQSAARAAVAPRQQQLKDLVERLALHRWTQILQTEIFPNVSDVRLKPDGWISWKEPIPSSTRFKDLSRSILSRRRTKGSPDVGALVRTLYQFSILTGANLQPYRGCGLPPQRPMSAHAFLAERHGLLEDWRAWGLDLGPHI